MTAPLLVLVAGLAGCGVLGGGREVCATADAMLVEDGTVTCARALDAVRYAEVLAARPLTGTQRDHLLTALAAHAESDPDAVGAALADAAAAADRLAAGVGLVGAEARSTAVYAAVKGGGALPEATFPDAAAVVDRAIAPWATDDDLQLALTEMDVEGWIRYVSLAREVQGGGPLKVSVADRVTVYRQVVDRWKGLDRAGKVALAALGPFWPAVVDRWGAASYATQQRWIGSAPLPGPMTATSLGYLEAVTASDVRLHVVTLHAELGPFVVGGR